MDDFANYKLDVEINDADLVEWLETLPEDDRQKEILATLKAGRYVLSLAQGVTSTTDDLKRALRPVFDKMDEVNSTMDTILNATKKSQRLGELGEAIVAKQLQDAFPNDQFRIVSSHGHQADIHADIQVNPEVVERALVEVKLYTGDVPTKELDKFRKDLISTGTKFGVMTSLTSRIMGMQGPIRVEENADYTAIFVSGAGIDGLGTLQAMATLKAIMLYKARTEAAIRITASAIEQAWQRVSREIEEFKAISHSVQSFRRSIQSVQQNIFEQLNKLSDDANRAEIRIQLAVERLTERVTNELKALPESSQALSLPEVITINDTLVELERLERDKDKRAQNFRSLFEVVQEENLDLSIEDGKWYLSKNEKILGWTAGTKTRLDLIVPVSNDEELRLLPSMEKYKDQTIIINGKEPNRAIARFRQHNNLN